MERTDRLLRLPLDREVQTRRELDGAHHPHGVLAEADHRVADRAYDALLEVLEPAHVVDHREVLDVVEEAVHREVAAVGVRLGRAERVVLKRPLRRVLDDLAHRLRILAERGRLDHLLAEADVREAETAADEEAVAERALHLVRLRARAHVEVLRLAPEQEIAHPSPHEIGHVSQPGKTIKDLQRIRIDVFARNAMISPCANHGLGLFVFFSSKEAKHEL